MSTDLDDFADLDFDDDVDEFADLDEFAEPEAAPNAVDLNKPLCLTCGNGEAIPGPTKRSKCQRCNQPWAWDAVTEEPPVKAKKDGPPRPIISGHCAWPQTKDPHLSHLRCAAYGSGSRANPDKRFHPCPCSCHLAHTTEAGPAELWLPNTDGTYGEVETYDCGGCDGLLAEAPIYGTDEDGDPVYVHVSRRNHQMLYTGPCR